MATRPVFYSFERAPFSLPYDTDFVWNPGLSSSQKKKNIAALHASYTRRFPERKLLEISSKSLEPFGVALSAFNLKKYVPSLGKSISVECIYQGSKHFNGGGPYTELYEGTSRTAKKDPRLKESGSLVSFDFEGRSYPLTPRNAFYNWIYINAILENEEYAKKLTEYDSFTDIEFSPSSSSNCQAAAAAMFVSLSRLGLIEECRDFDRFVEIVWK